ncbi:MAG: TonB-dependent receptor plug domain-containing protein, partial [Bdellovibrionota bacterium]
EKQSYLTYETQIIAQTEKRDDKTRSLDQSEFMTVPGANGDPVKAVQNLPGVNRASAFSSQVIIEGSSPNDTRYNIDDQVVPIIFHFGGLSSVVIPEAVDHVDYLSAGFGPEYGQSIAGLVNLTIKDPQTDRIHGFAFVDFLNVGGMVEGPINDHSSFLVGARQSYTGFIFGAVAKNFSSNFSLVAAPDFEDLVFKYKNQFTPLDTFTLVTVGSRDTLGLVFNPTTAAPTSFSLETDFFRIVPEWVHRFSSSVSFRASLGIGMDWNFSDGSTSYSHTTAPAITGRAETEAKINETWRSFWGIDTQFYVPYIDFQRTVSFSQGGISDPATATTVSVVNRFFSNATGLYWRNVIHRPESPWTLTPGVRVSYFNLTGETLPQPRIGARYKLSPGWTFRAATGLYDEAPPVQDFDATYGNRALKAQQAVHATLGLEKDFHETAAEGLNLSSDVFYKHLYSLVASTPTSNFDNSGYGNIFGLEFLGKYKRGIWDTWISYTLSRSTRGDARTAEALSNFDQTHLLTAVLEVDLPKNWKISGRVRYTSGNPYTPVTSSIYDADNDGYVPTLGAIYSARLTPFFQLDVRADKKWVFDRWILTAYLDIENITNQANAQQLVYSYDFSQAAAITGLPIFPTLGVKAEF